MSSPGIFDDEVIVERLWFVLKRRPGPEDIRHYIDSRAQGQWYRGNHLHRELQRCEQAGDREGAARIREAQAKLADEREQLRAYRLAHPVDRPVPGRVRKRMPAIRPKRRGARVLGFERPRAEATETDDEVDTTTL